MNLLESVKSKFAERRASTSQGVSLIVEIIFLSIGIYVAAFILPGALTAIATTALTSVNSGVITIFQVLVPIVAVVTLILLLLSVVRRATGR